MNKLAFFGVIILGLMLLLTHLVVTDVLQMGIYRLIGSLLIICGTAFLAIALLKRLKTTK